MIKILFICYGNICRSPMAEFVLKDMVNKKGLSADFFIESAATSNEEIGNPIHYGTIKKLKEEGINFNNRQAKQLKKSDYEKFDYLIGMETYNIREIQKIVGNDKDNKIYRLLDFTNNPRDIADPWYTHDFDSTYNDIVKGCEALLQKLV